MEKKELVETKKPWQSKTNVIAFIIGVVGVFSAPVSSWISTNPEAFSAITGGIFIILRMVTKGRITIK